MPHQHALVLAALCALLPWSLCTECDLQQQPRRCPETLQFQEMKRLTLIEGLDLDACKKQCCEEEQWYLFKCEGEPFKEFDTCPYSF